MATANRTLQFVGYAYGNTPVLLNAHINGTTVFSGEVPTLNEPIPATLPGTQVLFSVVDSPLFSTEFSGEYPMTISVANGTGIYVGQINSNYMPIPPAIVPPTATMENSTIEGTTLTVGTLVDGTGPIIPGMILNGTGINQRTTIISGSDLTWTVDVSQTLAATTIIGAAPGTPTPGNATAFSPCFFGSPTNSEGTFDPRSNVSIDGITQVPTYAPVSTGVWSWLVYQGSTLGCNLNISQGNAG